MKYLLVYLFVALGLASSQYFLGGHILILVIWVLLGVLAALAGAGKRLFLAALAIQLLIGFILFFKLNTNDASYVVQIVQDLGYSATVLKVVIVLFNGFTAAFALLLGSSLVGLVKKIGERKKQHT